MPHEFGLIEGTTKEFEYSFEFSCSDTTIKMMHSDFALAKAENENAITSWEQADNKQGTRYTALCAFDEPKLNDRQRILERTNEGRIEVRLKGVKFGRKRSIVRKLLFALHNDGIGATQIFQRLKIARSTVIRF